MLWTVVHSYPPNVTIGKGCFVAEQASAVTLPPGKDYRIVAIANLALSPASVREYAGASLRVPSRSAYLSNIAVDISLRRCGATSSGNSQLCLVCINWLSTLLCPPPANLCFFGALMQSAVQTETGRVHAGGLRRRCEFLQQGVETDLFACAYYQ